MHRGSTQCVSTMLPRGRYFLRSSLSTASLFLQDEWNPARGAILWAWAPYSHAQVLRTHLRRKLMVPHDTFLYRQMAAVARETLALQHFKSRAYAGDSLWKVRGLQNFSKSSSTELSYSPTRIVNPKLMKNQNTVVSRWVWPVMLGEEQTLRNIFFMLFMLGLHLWRNVHGLAVTETHKLCFISGHHMEWTKYFVSSAWGFISGLRAPNNTQIFGTVLTSAKVSWYKWKVYGVLTPSNQEGVYSCKRIAIDMVGVWRYFQICNGCVSEIAYKNIQTCPNFFNWNSES